MAGRPDPRPTRFLAAISGLAAATAIAAGLIQPAPPPADDGVEPAGAVPEPAASSAPVAAVRVRRETRYVQLQPGETAPPGARVVRRPDPSPRVVVVTIPAPAAAAAPAPPAAPAPVRKVRTRQSGG
jgi:hypothetical protein